MIHRAGLALAGALLICSGVSHAVECQARTDAGGTVFTACRVNLKVEQLELFWRDDSGRPYRQFSALREALALKGKQLIFAVNAGMYQPNFSPVGLFVAQGQELVPLNRHVGSGNFSQQPNGVFLVEGGSARVMSTDEYAGEHPRPCARDAIGAHVGSPWRDHDFRGHESEFDLAQDPQRCLRALLGCGNLCHQRIPRDIL